MKKTLRLSFVCLLALVSGNAWAQEVTLDFTENTWNLPEGNSEGKTESASFSSGGYTITLAASTKYYFHTDGYLMLGKENSTLTLPAFNFNVSKIEITGTSGASAAVKQNIFVGDDAISTETTGAKDVTNAYDIPTAYQAAGTIYTLKVTSKHNTQVTVIKIYKAGEDAPVTVTPPTISGTTPFTGSTQVTITGVPDGGSVKYTTDGSDPANGTIYSAPFTISETTTVKAIAYDEDDNASTVVEKTFTKVEEVVAENIAAFNALEDKTEATLTLKNAKVLFGNSNYVVLNDGTAGIVFYNTGLTYEAGQILNGTVKGKLSYYGGLPELAKTSQTNADDITASNGTVTASTTTISAINSGNILAGVVKIENVEIISKPNGTRTDFYATDGTNEIRLFDQFKFNGSTYSFTTGTGYTLEGIVGIYNEVKQLYPVKEPETQVVVETPEVKDFAEILTLSSGDKAKIKLDKAQILYVFTTNNGNTSVYLRDNSGAMQLYIKKADNITFPGTANQLVSGELAFTYSPYYALPEIVINSETDIDGLSFTDGSKAEPKAISVADVLNNLNDLVVLKDVPVSYGDLPKTGSEDTYKGYMIGSSDNLAELYNGFYISGYEDLSVAVDEKATITGIVGTVYQGNARVYPIEDGIITSGVNLIKADNDVNAPIYNLSGQRVQQVVRGIYIQNGKKFVVK